MKGMYDLYDEELERSGQPATHTCKRCGKTGLWWDFAPGELLKRVLWGKRPRGHNGPHQCDLSSHFEDES